MSTNKKNVILTFDYEVFLGRETGTIENCVIKPTKSILRILKENNAKAIFFVDATWLLFLRDYSHSDFQTVSDQLKEIIKIGSSLELHLHPQWLHANKIGDKIEFKSFENYRLHSLNQDEIIELFSKSIDLIEEITYQKVLCFRAGGFCIDPFNQIKKAFEEFKIKYDFSVATRMKYIEGNGYDFDFSKTPRLPYYRFQDDAKKPDNNGYFVEIPLSTYLNNPVYRITNKLLLRLKKDKIFGDGISIQETNVSSSRLFRRLSFQYTMITIDQTDKLLFNYLLKMHFRNSDFLTIISHPKNASKEALKNLRYITENFNTLNTIDLEKFFVAL